MAFSLDEAAARLAVAETVVLYSHLLDDQDYDRWVTLFAHDAVLCINGKLIAGRDRIRAIVPKSQPRPPGRHAMSPAVIRLDGQDEASAWSDMTVILPSATGTWDMTSTWRYADRLRRIESSWVFTHRYMWTPDGTRHPDAPIP